VVVNKGVSVMSIVLYRSPTQNSAGPILPDPEFLLQIKAVVTTD